jgi:hypothetical protein
MLYFKRNGALAIEADVNLVEWVFHLIQMSKDVQI